MGTEDARLYERARSVRLPEVPGGLIRPGDLTKQRSFPKLASRLKAPLFPAAPPFLEDAECIIGNHIRDVARMAVTQSLAGSTRRHRQNMPAAPRRWSTSAGRSRSTTTQRPRCRMIDLIAVLIVCAVIGYVFRDRFVRGLLTILAFIIL